jgi:hypothetical protein
MYNSATVNIQGAQKDGWESIAGVGAGTSSLSLASLPTANWQVGDRLLFSGTGAGSQDETVLVTSVAGNTVSFTPLQYDHLSLDW